MLACTRQHDRIVWRGCIEIRAHDHALLFQQRLIPTVAGDPLSRAELLGLRTQALLNFPDGLCILQFDRARRQRNDVNVRVVEARHQHPTAEIDLLLGIELRIQLLATDRDDVAVPDRNRGLNRELLIYREDLTVEQQQVRILSRRCLNGSQRSHA